jgi:hypothetical protein
LSRPARRRHFKTSVCAPNACRSCAVHISEIVTTAVSRALDDRHFVDMFNPFARSHHSDLTTSEGVSPMSASGAFKRSVAAYYGLEHEDSSKLYDMFGHVAEFRNVTLAHIYPKSFTNHGDFAAEMALPPAFNTHPRNYLLLPRAFHSAYDAGWVALIPRSHGTIRVRVFQPHRVPADIRALDGRDLHLPKARGDPSKLPFLRVLGWFAWLAKGATVVSDDVMSELEAALSASQSGEGNGRLRARSSRRL